MAQLLRKDQSLSMPDWSQLPEELLHLISNNLEDHCFDVIHARSVCSSWRSTFPFPSSLLRPSYSLPTPAEFESKELCTLEKVPLFLFRVNTPPLDVAAAVSPSKYFLGGISQDDDHTELQSPLQCSVKVKIPRSDPTLMNMLDCQILSLGHQYRMMGWDPEELSRNYRRVAFLPQNEDGGRGEFVVLLNHSNIFLVLRSVEMKWMQVKLILNASCKIVTFRGRFYAASLSGFVFVIDPYSLEVIPLKRSKPLSSSSYLVPCGNDELFLVEKIIPASGLLSFSQSACRVRRLDEEAGKWVVVNDLGDRVLFIGHLGNVCCLAKKELPDGCGLSGNSIVFTYDGENVSYTYKYEEHTGRAEDNLSFWRPTSENRVLVLNR